MLFLNSKTYEILCLGKSTIEFNKSNLFYYLVYNYVADIQTATNPKKKSTSNIHQR